MCDGAQRVKLLAEVADVLEASSISFALIGAGALAVHGVSRSTQDLDLLSADNRCFDAVLWMPLREGGGAVEVRRGDVDDPLAGVVRFSRDDSRPVDLIVGRHRFEERVVERAVTTRVAERSVPVASPSDLILLKLYAGGPQDAWDIHQLLDAGDRPALIAGVAADLDDLPTPARDLWRRIVDSDQ